MGREYLISDAKSLKLVISVPSVEMLAEAKNLRTNFIKYNQGDDYKHVGWHSLPLYGLGDDKTLAWRGYGYTNAEDAIKDMDWTTWSVLCPITTKWLKEIFPSKQLGRVRFMLLEAGGYIAPHTDSDQRILEAVNIALNNPVECKWEWSDGTELVFNPGDAMAVNISYEHAIYNRSQEDRYHLIIHHYDSLPSWKELMINSMKEHNVQGNFLYSQELY